VWISELVSGRDCTPNPNPNPNPSHTHTLTLMLTITVAVHCCDRIKRCDMCGSVN